MLIYQHLLANYQQGIDLYTNKSKRGSSCAEQCRLVTTGWVSKSKNMKLLEDSFGNIYWGHNLIKWIETQVRSNTFEGI